MKVLLSAFTCAPGRGSEPNIGWNVALQVATVHETWVLTDAFYKPKITEALQRTPISRLRFAYVSVPPPISWMRSLGSLHYAYYITWQILAFFRARSLHQRVRFDLVHHVTYVNSWLPTWMGWLDVPFVWSAGNRDITPRYFLAGMSRRGRIAEFVRNWVVVLWSVLTRILVASRAKLILTSSDTSKWPANLPVVRFPLGGLDTTELQHLFGIPERKSAPFRIASIGRLLGLKGFHLALEAFARVHRVVPESEYWIIGDGPERAALEARARELRCADAVRFLGRLPRSQVLERLSEIDVLVHPSLHEQFGYVILEAMAAGRPVICLDIAGPSVLVAEDCGFAVPVESPPQVVNDLFERMLFLAQHPQRRLQMGIAARERVLRHLSWDVVGRSLLGFYEQVKDTRPSAEAIPIHDSGGRQPH